MLVDGMARRANARRVAIIVELCDDDKGQRGQQHHRRRGHGGESHAASAKPREQPCPTRLSTLDPFPHLTADRWARRQMGERAQPTRHHVHAGSERTTRRAASQMGVERTVGHRVERAVEARGDQRLGFGMGQG
jgi:hypothetical protein